MLQQCQLVPRSRRLNVLYLACWETSIFLTCFLSEAPYLVVIRQSYRRQSNQFNRTGYRICRLRRPLHSVSKSNPCGLEQEHILFVRLVIVDEMGWYQQR
jgi:hypothetical protein